MNLDKIPYGKQSISETDIKSVIETLKSDFLTQGPKVKEFENKFADYIGSDFAISVSNGTAALHLCNMALGLEPGDKVITSPITFSATANSIRYCGGEVVFSDIDPQTYLLDYNKVKRLLEKSPKGTYKGIIPVDFAGKAINMERFKVLANEYDLWIIEDACHAPGGYFIDSKKQKQYCGNGNYADLSIFSFHPVKHIATGEGGMITTNNKNLYNKILKLRSHGITKNSLSFKNSISTAGGKDEYPLWYMEMHDLGFNYRLNDIQSALGISQLNSALNGLKKRKEIVNFYNKSFKNKGFLKSDLNLDDGHAYHLYVLKVKNRLGLYNYLRENNIFTQIHYFPCHLMPYYRDIGWSLGDFAVAEEYYKYCISLPIFPSLSDNQLTFITQKVISFYED